MNTVGFIFFNKLSRVHCWLYIDDCLTIFHHDYILRNSSQSSYFGSFFVINDNDLETTSIQKCVNVSIKTSGRPQSIQHCVWCACCLVDWKANFNRSQKLCLVCLFYC